MAIIKKYKQMKIKFKKSIITIHRDLGFFFFGMCVIYGISGIAMNHIKDWNPNYIIKRKKITLNVPDSKKEYSKEKVLEILKTLEEDKYYKSYYFPEENDLKIFIKNGSVNINILTGQTYIEKIKRRPLFGQTTFLHYNPGKLWTYFSDFFAFSLILIAITGLFIIKGKNGITGRGGWLTAIGIIIPVILFLMYL